MSNLSVADIARPPINRDMKVLDRSFFRTKLQTSALTVFNPRDIQKIKSKLATSHDLLLATTIKPVRNDETTTGAKCIVLLPHIKANDPSTWSENWSDLVTNGIAKVRPFELVLTYDDWSMADILGAILPEISEDEGQNPSGFAQVGHVAHLNLREQFLPYKYLIGQVLVDKNHGIKTIINKLQDVGTESVFRTFPYEVLAGPDDLDVTVHHANCEFKFNFGEVYWNTRNGHEHERLVASFQGGQAICDVMAGVGPFAVPAGKKQIWVRANDLNPAGFRAMVAAIQANKVQPFVQAYNMDGRDFIRLATRDLLIARRTFKKKPKVVLSRKATVKEKQQANEDAAKNTTELVEPRTFDHFIMNLPASAIEFLDAYKGLYHGQEHLFNSRKLPMIHVYTFQVRDEDDNEEKEKSDLLGRLSSYLGYNLNKERDEVTLHRARLVAPKKLYYCASFRLPSAVAFAAEDG